MTMECLEVCRFLDFAPTQCHHPSPVVLPHCGVPKINYYNNCYIMKLVIYFDKIQKEIKLKIKKTTTDKQFF